MTVTLVGVVTCPLEKRNWVKANPAGIVTDDGTGTADGSLLVNETTAPPVGAGPLSCTSPTCSVPLRAAVRPSNETDDTVGAAEPTVNDRTTDQSVTAAVVADALPSACRTRQNFVPALTLTATYCELVCPLICSSTFERAESVATCAS